MSTDPKCPKCSSANVYQDGNLWICPECSNEWSVHASAASAAEQIQALERELGARLIRRRGRVVTLTDEGRAVVEAGRDILARVADLGQIAQLGRLRGNLRIGSVSTALVSIVPPALRGMAARYPEIALNIRSIQLHQNL